MTATDDPARTVPALLEELDGLADPRILEVNRRHGDEHAVNLSALRAVAKRLRSDHELALALWATGQVDARLLALLIAKPRLLSPEELDAMLREAGTPKVQDWLVNYMVRKSKHAEVLRGRWMEDPDPVVQSAGWALTSEAVAKHPEVLDLTALLDDVEARMATAPERLQWAMNQTLATIGIEHQELRERALAIGERLGVLRDYPTSAGCISPFAPIWITEMVARREEA
ncbi:DNA alkylation repair protein [Brachybacterium sp. NBEC-018]|uniref:DNA alkylation repair protein n=1 Tax=Brachybacterium sp. NBEC-018 TaxID=2996004 RepID=UPI0021752F1F|nr:DNA alkylation repair protein [Brachybacterium sp. NBEC-018]UVY85380.1 DNA alkylation repair protein [Brachybacterium sp. NBEC-018]